MRPPNTGTVDVAREQMAEPLGQERLRGAPRLAPRLPDERAGRDLDQRARRDCEADPGDVALRDVVPLGVSEHDGEPGVAKTAELVEQLLGPAPVRELDQQD